MLILHNAEAGLKLRDGTRGSARYEGLSPSSQGRLHPACSGTGRSHRASLWTERQSGQFSTTLPLPAT